MELSKKMVIRFPNLFSENCSIIVGDGWEHILTNMCCGLLKHSKYLKITKIKEKFGKMRIYIKYSDGKTPNDDIFDEINDIISHFSEQSETTCYDCGVDCTIQQLNNGWHLSICKSCKENRENE